jgi:hypothetical protein
MTWGSVPPAGAKLYSDVLAALFAERTPYGAWKLADEVVNGSATLQNDDELFVAVPANTRFAIRGLVNFTSNTTANFRLDWTGPTGYTHITNTKVYSRIAAAPTQLVDTRTFIEGALVGASGAASLVNSTHGQLMELSGWLQTSSTAGTAQIRWSQNTSNGSNTTVYANSFIMLEKVA